jgi:hypothetical protein
MHSSQEPKVTPNAELTTVTKIFAEGWRLTNAIFALKGMEIPRTIPIQVDGENHDQETRIATLEDLANTVLSLDELVAHPSDRKPSKAALYGDIGIEQLTKQRDALVELQKRVTGSGDPTSTTVIEALFPNVPVKKRVPGELERWRAIRKEEGLKIAPETAEVTWWYAQTLDPYGLLDEWELPEEVNMVGREYFARAPGSEIWVEFTDLPEETRDKLWKKHRSELAFPAGLDRLSPAETAVLRFLNDRSRASEAD